MAHDLNETLIFIKVVSEGSFTAAATSLQLPNTTVSRKVRELEKRLGIRLLHRTTRKLSLTEAGAIYFDRSNRIVADLERAEADVAQLLDKPRGWLRITAPHSFTVALMAPLLSEFMGIYPEIKLDVMLSTDTLDVAGENIDVALRLGPVTDLNLIRRPLGMFTTHVYASPGYLSTHGEPTHPDQLRSHRTLCIYNDRRAKGYAWSLCRNEAREDYLVEPVMVANDPEALKASLIAGQGLALGFQSTMAPLVRKKAVRRILSDWIGPQLELNAVYPPGHGHLPKVRAFVEFMIARLERA